MSNATGIPENATVSLIFDEIVKERLQEVSLEGISGIIQFDITGDQGGKWYIEAKDGRGELKKGEHPEPTTTFTVDADVYLKIARQELNPQAAFMQGQLRVSGDMGIAMKLGQLLREVMEKKEEPAEPVASRQAETSDEAEKIAGLSEEEFLKVLANASVSDIFNKYLPARMRTAWEKYKEMMAGIQGILQFDITGENGGKWFFEISDQGISVHQGEHSQPTTTFQMEAQDYLAMTRRETDPQTLFMSGKMRVLGDMSLAMRLGQVMQSAMRGSSP